MPPRVRPPPVKRDLWWYFDPEERAEMMMSVWGRGLSDIPCPQMALFGPPRGGFREVLEASGSGEDPLRRPAAVIVDYLIEPGRMLWSEWLSHTSLKWLPALASWGKTVWIDEFWNRVSHIDLQAANPAASSWEPITAPLIPGPS